MGDCLGAANKVCKWESLGISAVIEIFEAVYRAVIWNYLNILTGVVLSGRSFVTYQRPKEFSCFTNTIS